MENQENIALELTKRDLVTLTNALNEVLNGPDAIDAWEFATRMGVEPVEAGQLLAKLSKLNAAVNSVRT